MPDTVPFTTIADANPPVAGVLQPGTLVSFIPMADVSDTGEWTNRQIRDVSRVSTGFTVFQENDVLFAKITPCMENGKGCHALGLRNGIGFGSTEFIILRAKGKNDARFIFHWTRNRALRKAAEMSMTGSAGQQRVQPSFFARFHVPSMAPDEQTAIAGILDTVDEATRQTAAVIEKLKKIKAGLLHDLLTRGIDEAGQLRDPIRHPEQFKDSPLGQVPKVWEVLKVRDMLARHGGHVQTGPFGSQLHASEYAVSGVPVVMPQDIRADGEISLDSIARITVSRAKDLSRHFLQLNDLVFARRGDLSRCSPIHARAEGWICGTGCLLMRPPAKAIRADWFASLYRHDLCQRQIAARAVGSTMVNLNTGLILDLLIPHPHPDEQARIEAILRQHDNRIQAEAATHRKLTLMKQGLMQDLLTGRVRVNVGSAAGKTVGKAATR